MRCGLAKGGGHRGLALRDSIGASNIGGVTLSGNLEE